MILASPSAYPCGHIHELGRLFVSSLLFQGRAVRGDGCLICRQVFHRKGLPLCLPFRYREACCFKEIDL